MSPESKVLRLARWRRQGGSILPTGSVSLQITAFVGRGRASGGRVLRRQIRAA